MFSNSASWLFCDVYTAGHRNGCNAAFMNGGSDWIEAEKMTEELWEPKWRAKEP